MHQANIGLEQALHCWGLHCKPEEGSDSVHPAQSLLTNTRSQQQHQSDPVKWPVIPARELLVPSGNIQAVPAARLRHAHNGVK